MRALIRMRTLAAACALLLFVSGTAMAGWADRPIDRSGGAPPTTEAGDPDEPGGNRLTAIVFLGRVFILRLPAGLVLPRPVVHSATAIRSAQRARHAR